MGIIIKPIVTEKQTAITEKFPNRYGFRVSPDANKLEIKKAVEDMYSVTVVDVNTINYSGKRKSRYTKSGIINGKQAAFKKAIVTLKEGENNYEKVTRTCCCRHHGRFSGRLRFFRIQRPRFLRSYL